MTHLCGQLSEDRVLDPSQVWLMACSVHVLEGATLTLLPGTTVRSVPRDQEGLAPTLVVHRGGRLIANGTRDAPITFSAIETHFESDVDVVTDSDASRNGTVSKGLAGKWGGVIIAGRAPLSCGAEDKVEGLPEETPVYFGGADPLDDSGVLRYVRIWYAGAVLVADNEVNGLTLAAVGAGTTIEYVEVALSIDDGIEFFGGTVSMRHISVLFVGDDALDFDAGYKGNLQFVFVMLGSNGDHVIEADGGLADGSGPDSMPRSHPVISSFSFIGGGKGGRESDTLVFREGAAGTLSAGVVTHGTQCATRITSCGDTRITQQWPPGQRYLPARTAGTVPNVSNASTPDFWYWSPDNIISDEYSCVMGTESSCFADDMMQTLATRRGDPGFVNLNLSCVDYWSLQSSFNPLPLASGAACATPPVHASNDSFFSPVQCAGAFASPDDDWLSGWSYSTVAYASPSLPPPPITPRPLLPTPMPTPHRHSFRETGGVLFLALAIAASVGVCLACFSCYFCNQKRLKLLSRVGFKKKESSPARFTSSGTLDTESVSKPKVNLHHGDADAPALAPAGAAIKVSTSLPSYQTPSDSQNSTATSKPHVSYGDAPNGSKFCVGIIPQPLAAPTPPATRAELFEHEPSISMFTSLKMWNAYREFVEVRTIGRGSQGRAVLLKNARTGELVVSKEVWAVDMTDLQLARVEREVRILSMLKHPHIVRYLASFQREDVLCIITEYAAGGTLRTAIRQQRQASGAFSSEQVIAWLVQLASALYAVHANNVLHRDIKADNVFLTAEADIKLGDFGLSSEIEESNLAKTACGTPYYTSPEQISGEGYSQPADVWSLGVLLFELLTLSRPFEADSYGKLAVKICNGDYDVEALDAAQHPAELKALVTGDAMLALQPHARTTLPQLVVFLRELLAPILQGRNGGGGECGECGGGDGEGDGGHGGGVHGADGDGDGDDGDDVSDGNGDDRGSRVGHAPMTRTSSSSVSAHAMSLSNRSIRDGSFFLSLRSLNALSLMSLPGIGSALEESIEPASDESAGAGAGLA
mmetsp:Transcript_4272/g.9311  ORF Transcript_4272/g.9311 Transcript_4272/m.9311 type:complete len:1043 (+) Transcript_4272:293-3421(+)